MKKTEPKSAEEIIRHAVKSYVTKQARPAMMHLLERICADEVKRYMYSYFDKALKTYEDRVKKLEAINTIMTAANIESWTRNIEGRLEDYDRRLKTMVGAMEERVQRANMLAAARVALSTNGAEQS